VDVELSIMPASTKVVLRCNQKVRLGHHAKEKRRPQVAGESTGEVTPRRMKTDFKPKKTGNGDKAGLHVMQAERP